MLNVVQILYSGLGGQASVFFSLVEADLIPARSPDDPSGNTGIDSSADQQARNRNHATLARHHAVFYGTEALVDDYREKCQELGISCRAWHKGPGLDLGNQWRIARYVVSLEADVFVVHSPQWIIAGKLVKWFRPACRIVAVEHHPNMLKTRAKWWLSASIPWLADTVVYLTGRYQQQVKERIGLFFREKRAVIIPNGVNVERFYPSVQYRARGDTVGMAARLSDQKDIDTLLRAFAKLVKRYPERPLTLRLAGDGPHRAALESLTDSLEIADVVIFEGMLSENEMVVFYQSLSLYVHATRSETMSTSVVQALSCGLPVIASDIPGMADILPKTDDHQTLVPVGNAEKLFDRMDYLLSDAERLERLAGVSRRYAEQHLSSAVSLKRYLEMAT